MLLRRAVPSGSHHTVVSTFHLLPFQPGFYHAFAGRGRIGKWGSSATCEEVEEARSAPGLCQWKLLTLLCLHTLSPSCPFTATWHTLLSNVSCCETVALIKLFCLSACLYRSCLSLLWNTNHGRSNGGWGETDCQQNSNVQWERCECTSRTN